MPFAWIIIVLLCWLVSGVSMNRKAKAAKAKQLEEKEKARQKTAEQYARRQAQPKASPQPAFQPAAPAMSRQDDWDDEEENWDERDAARSRPAPAPKPAQAPRHETRPLQAHMHTPVMGAEGTGTEGEDCCHEFMLDQRLESQPADFLPMQEENEGLRAKALLQGVIYSEILGRRPVKRYGAKGA